MDSRKTIIINESDFEDDEELAANNFVVLEDANTKEWEVASRDYASDEVGLERGKNQRKRPTMGDEEDLFSSDDDIVEVKPIKKPKVDRGKRVQRWCVTYNNPKVTAASMDELLKKCDALKGFVFQEETGASGTQHFQMYLEFKAQQFCSAVRKAVGTESISTFMANGSKKQNIAYCSKEETRTGECFKWGSCTEEVGQGRRNDVDDFVREVVAVGQVNADIIEAHPGAAVRFARQARDLVAALAQQRARRENMEYWVEQRRLMEQGVTFAGQEQRECVLLFGPSAVGKTTMVNMETLGKEETLYEKPNDIKWFDNLEESDQHILFDEFKGGEGITMHKLLNLTNKGMHLVEGKGHFTCIGAETKFWFSTNRHPIHWYKSEFHCGEYQALMRRFKQVIWWKDSTLESKVVLENPGKKPENASQEETEVWTNASNEWKHFWKHIGSVQVGDAISANGRYTDANDRTITYFDW